MVQRGGASIRGQVALGIDGPADILTAVPGTRLLEWVRWFESDTYERLSRAYRVLGALMALLPATANMSQYHRYGF